MGGRRDKWLKAVRCLSTKLDPQIQFNTRQIHLVNYNSENEHCPTFGGKRAYRLCIQKEVRYYWFFFNYPNSSLTYCFALRSRVIWIKKNLSKIFIVSSASGQNWQSSCSGFSYFSLAKHIYSLIHDSFLSLYSLWETYSNIHFCKIE